MTALIEVENLTVMRTGKCILSAAAFRAGAGEFIGVIGPNGAGKSTLLRAIAGIETSNDGAVRICGASVSTLPHRERARRVAFLPQMREVHWGVTAETVVALGRYAFGAPRRLAGEDRVCVENAISAAQIAGLRDRIVTTLSGGEQARVHLARALAANTPILITDEPTAALDPRHRLEIMDILAQRARDGGLVIAALHDLDLAAHFCTRIILMNDGRIVADAPPNEALSTDKLESVFAVRARRLGDDAGASSFLFTRCADQERLAPFRHKVSATPRRRASKRAAIKR